MRQCLGFVRKFIFGSGIYAGGASCTRNPSRMSFRKPRNRGHASQVTLAAPSRPLWRCLSGILATLAASGVLSGATAAKKQFDIPAGGAERTLRLFLQQADIDLVYTIEKVEGVTTHGVKGTFTAREVLDRMTANTGLIVVQDEKTGAYMLKRVAPDSSGNDSPPAPPSNSHSKKPATMLHHRLVASLATLFALVAAPPAIAANTADASESVITLSPFEVSAENDDGYRASGTLAGTRLRTDLKDVAASVSVVTKDFMRDINANDLESLLVFTLGTEVDGLGGNFSNSVLDSTGFQNFDLAVRQPTSGTRVRGLSSADTTLSFFLSSFPVDSYNVDRVEISRGPNAMLFGLGSPAGIINSSLIRAEPRRNKTEVTTQIGSYESTRTTVDHNQVLIKDKLAARVAGVYSDRYFRQEPNFSRTSRGFGTVTYRPFSSTTVRVSGERGDSHATKPRVNPPFDSLSWWWDIGRPIYNPSTGVMSYLGEPPDNPNIAPATATGGKNGSVITTGFGNTWNTNLGAIFESPTSSALGYAALPEVEAVKAVWERYRSNGSVLVNDGMSSLTNSNRYYNALHRGEITENFWRAQQINDPRIFDFYHQTIDGPDNKIVTHWKGYNVVLEQTLLKGQAGFELAFDRQDMNWSFENPYQHASYTLYLDINSHLPDGSVNPNMLRPVVADIGWTESSTLDRQAARATAYYNLDLRNMRGPEWLGRVLGRHTFTGAYTDQSQWAENFGGRENALDLDYIAAERTNIPSLANTTQEGRRGIARVIYVGPSIANASSPQDIGIQGPTVPHTLDNVSSISTLYYQPPRVGATVPGTTQLSSFSLLDQPDEDKRLLASFSANRSEVRTKSSSFVTQNFWLQDTLVTTLGWRTDRFATFDSGLPPYDPATGQRVLDDETLYAKPALRGSKTSFSWGVVGHLPKRIARRLPWGLDFSAFYNEADNFTPTAQRFDIYDRPIAPNTGSTKEYGVMMRAFGGKLDLRLTHYETASLYSTHNGLRAVVNNMATIPRSLHNNLVTGLYADPALDTARAALETWFGGSAAQTLANTFRFTYGADGAITSIDQRANIVVGPTDVASKGWELELTFNPTRNWRIAVNAANAEAIQSNTGEVLRQFLEDEFMPLMESPAGTLSMTGLPGGESLSARVRRQLLVPLYKIVLQDGSPNNELREWRWNMVTNYRFSHERLKNWSIGGSARWQDRVAIGFPVIDDASGLVGGPVYDVKNPYYGPSDITFGAHIGYQRKVWRGIVWRAQLTLKNIGVGNELIPVSAQPDGTTAAWRIREPQNWTFSNSFEF